jgi:predicted ATPase/class 3 adenylate cyclase
MTSAYRHAERLAPHDAALHSGMHQPRSLPAGAVTFLYTDIEGSTERWERAPNDMRHALVRHHALLRAAIESHGGVVYQIVGDAFVAIFADAPAAVAAALAAQRSLRIEPWPEAVAPLRVRMALHHGHGQYQDDGYHAEETLNRLFRLLSASYGGQIVLTAAVRELAGQAWPASIAVRDLGMHRLRDLTTTLHVWQVAAPDLPADFPPLRSLSQHPNNLPAQSTELYGRAAEIAAVVARLRGATTRQLTLTGLGGIGKTRLALAAAAELLVDFPDGVYLVALDQVQHVTQVAATLAATLGIRDAPGQSAQETLLQWLRPKRLLLVLDNCEHVLATMPMVVTLLERAPGLKVLVTSRVALGIYGEQEHAVPPLPPPAEHATAELPTLTQNAAVQLFVARAQAVSPLFRLSATNAEAVAAICVRLEGLPLAIELAAARVRALPPAQILARLSDRLDFLAAHSRDGPRRQQTLRATLEWSNDLLPPTERQLLAWLSVFVGGASLEAIAALWEHSGQQLDVVDGLMTLISHSLVQPSLDDEAPRYRLLELVRDFGREQLVSSGALAAVALEHARFFETFVARYDGKIRQDPAAPAAIAHEYPNLRAGLNTAIDQRDTILALRIGKPLIDFWHFSGAVREGWQLIQRVLALPLPADVSPEMRSYHARAQQSAPSLGHKLGQHAQGRALVEAALNTARELGDDRLTGDCLGALFFFLDSVADYDRCLAVLDESLALFRQIEHWHGAGMTHLRIGMVENNNQHLAPAQAHFTAALAIFRDIQSPIGQSAALNNLSDVLNKQGHYAQAAACLEEALPISYMLGERHAVIANLLNLGEMGLRRGNAGEAGVYLSHVLQWAYQYQQHVLVIYALGYVAWLAESLDQLEPAAALFGAYTQLIRQLEQANLGGFDPAPIDAAQQRARERLGEAPFSAAFAAGQQLAEPEALAAARAIVGVPPLDETGHPVRLTLPLAREAGTVTAGHPRPG